MTKWKIKIVSNVVSLFITFKCFVNSPKWPRFHREIMTETLTIWQKHCAVFQCAIVQCLILYLLNWGCWGWCCILRLQQIWLGQLLLPVFQTFKSDQNRSMIFLRLACKVATAVCHILCGEKFFKLIIQPGCLPVHILNLIFVSFLTVRKLEI